MRINEMSDEEFFSFNFIKPSEIDDLELPKVLKKLASIEGIKCDWKLTECPDA